MTTREITPKIFMVKHYAQTVGKFLGFAKADAKVTAEQGVKFHNDFVEACSSYLASNDKAEINLKKMENFARQFQDTSGKWKTDTFPVSIYGPAVELMQTEVVNNIPPDNPDSRKVRHAARAIQQIVAFHNRIQNKEPMRSIWQDIIQPASWSYSSPPKERQPKGVETAITGIQTSRHSRDKLQHCLDLGFFLNLRVQKHLNHSQ